MSASNVTSRLPIQDGDDQHSTSPFVTFLLTLVRFDPSACATSTAASAGSAPARLTEKASQTPSGDQLAPLALSICPRRFPSRSKVRRVPFRSNANVPPRAAQSTAPPTGSATYSKPSAETSHVPPFDTTSRDPSGDTS